MRSPSRLQTAVLLAGMLLFLCMLGVALPGQDTLVYVLISGILIFMFAQRLVRGWLQRLYAAIPLSRAEAPELHAIIDHLHHRAAILMRPEVLYLPSEITAAFVIGTQREPAIVVSDGLLRTLNTRELSAVLAHEVAHIKQTDIALFGLADVLMRLANISALIGQLGLLINLPLFLLGLTPFLLWPLLLMIAAPNLTALLQMLLPNDRELSADQLAVQISDDPHAFESALLKMQVTPRRFWRIILMPGDKIAQPSILRAHPPLAKRIQVLAAGLGGQSTNIKSTDTNTSATSDTIFGPTDAITSATSNTVSSPTDQTGGEPQEPDHESIKDLSQNLRMTDKLVAVDSAPFWRVNGLWY